MRTFSPVPLSTSTPYPALRHAFSSMPNIRAIGDLLYTRYLFIFEGAGLVLLVAMIGAIVLTHRERAGSRYQNISRQNARRPQDATRNTRPTVGQGVQL